LNISQRPKASAHQAAREFTPQHGIAAKTLGEIGRSACYFGYVFTSLCLLSVGEVANIPANPWRNSTNFDAHRYHKRHDNTRSRHSDVRRDTRDT
jgi:hypothetical protein